MKLSSKDRAFLRGEAGNLSPVVMVGKEGLTDNVVLALNDALFNHELVKVKFQQFKDDVKEISFSLAAKSDSTLIATTGFTAIFYKAKEKKEDRKYNI